MKKQGFIQGTVILMTANGISKILGAVFKIPLTYILKEEGMAVFNTAFQIYIMFLTFVISGFPFAISKTVAQVRNDSDRRAVVSISIKLLSVIGLCASVILFFFSDLFACALKEPSASSGIKAIAPSVFFVSLSTVYKGYYQGVSNMLPTAASQVAESIIRLGIGFGLAYYFRNCGSAAAAGGALGGVTAGEISSALLLLIIYTLHRKKINKNEIHKSSGMLRELIDVAIPLFFTSLMTNALSTVDTVVLRKSLIDCGISASKASFLYGSCTGYALTVFNLPVGVLATLGVSIVPIIAGAVGRGDLKRASSFASRAVKLMIYLSLPCAVGLYFTADKVLELLFSNTSSAHILILYAPCIVFICTAQLCISILQASGSFGAPFWMMGICGLIKIFATKYFVSNPTVNIDGAPVSSCIHWIILCIMCIAAIHIKFKIRLNPSELIIKPAVCAFIMGIFMYLVKDSVFGFFSNVFLQTFVILGLSVIVYGMALFLTGAVKYKDFKGFLPQKRV